MSRTTVRLAKPVDFISGKVSSVSYGLDHACGYFICALDERGEVVDEIDSYGFGLAGREALLRHSNSRMAELFTQLGLNKVAEQVYLDQPI